MRIRQFEKRDTNAVIKLANDYALFDGPISEADLEVTYSFPEGFLVAEDDNRIIGLAYGYFKDVPREVLDNWDVSKVATIELLVVDLKHRNQGVGATLLDRLLTIFKEAGTDLIGLHCPVQAIEAKQLYERFGFEISAFHMRKRLNSSTV